jgi:hypothetical protein
MGYGYVYMYMSGGNETDETKVAASTRAGRLKARNKNLCPPSKQIVDTVRVLIDD